MKSSNAKAFVNIEVVGDKALKMFNRSL